MTLAYVFIAILVWRYADDWAVHQTAAWSSVGGIYLFTIFYGISFGPVTFLPSLTRTRALAEILNPHRHPSDRLAAAVRSVPSELSRKRSLPQHGFYLVRPQPPTAWAGCLLTATTPAGHQTGSLAS
jgi:hypothetical protein